MIITRSCFSDTPRNSHIFPVAAFLRTAISQPGDARCQDEDVTSALVSGLGLPADSHGDIVKESRQLAFEKCWPADKDAIKKSFNEDSSGSYQNNTCTDLKKKGALSNLQLKRCSEKH